jgi:MoaA/NifB/PqqE/SkfB family radical SAM enzyme
MLAHWASAGFVETTNGTAIAATEGNGLCEDPWGYQFAQPFLARPWFALWEVTDRCPRKGECVFCYRPPNDATEPDRATWERVVAEIFANEIPFVTLLGGEPICHPDVQRIISRLRARNIYVKIITNGVMADEPTAQALAEAGLNQAAVSFDGLTEAVNDLSRGPGAFATAVNGVAWLRAAVPRVSLSLTISNRSYTQLDDLPRFCEALGVREIYLSPLRATADKPYPAGLAPLNPLQMTALHERAEALNEQGLKVVGLRECSCGRSSVVIHPNSDVSPCPFAESRFGNLQGEDLAAIWSRITGAAAQLGPVRAGATCFRRFEN